MSGGGLELSFVTDDEGWLMFDSMTADAVSMAPVIASFDTVVADIIANDPEINSMVTDMVRAEYVAKGWIRV